MRISKINVNKTNFGRVTKAAAEQVIKQAGVDINKLDEIKDLVEEQENNDRYDITLRKQLRGIGYDVVSAESKRRVFVHSFKNFDTACYAASKLKAQDEERLRQAELDAQKKPRALELADEILAKCKD